MDMESDYLRHRNPAKSDFDDLQSPSDNEVKPRVNYNFITSSLSIILLLLGAFMSILYNYRVTLRIEAAMLEIQRPYAGYVHGELDWWQSAVVYRLDMGTGSKDRKFTDIISKLEDFKDLNIGVFSIGGIYACDKHGILDHVKINPQVGTSDEFDQLISEIHMKGLKLLVDYIPNHTSIKHEWFIESMKTPPNDQGESNHYRDFYIWKEGRKNKDGSLGPPNNWMSHTGGSAWTWNDHRKQFYLHQFSDHQPDLNWRNPNVRRAMTDMLSEWLKRGVDGFRVIGVKYLIEDESLSDEPIIHGENSHQLNHSRTQQQPETFAMIRNWVELLKHYKNSSVLLVDVDDDARGTPQYYNAGVQLPNYMALRGFSSTNGGHALGDIVGNLLSNLTQHWPTFQISSTATDPYEDELLKMMLMLLPGTIVYENDAIEIKRPNTDRFKIMANLKKTPTIARGMMDYIIVDDDVFSFTRNLENYPDYLIAMNIGKRESKNDFTKENILEADDGEIIFTTENFKNEQYRVGSWITLKTIDLKPRQGLVIKLHKEYKRT